MQKYIKFVLYLIIVVLVNLICFSAFQRFDLTKNQAYSLSEVSKTSVSQLTDPLTINVFFSSNLPAPYNGIETYLKDLMAEYALSANRYFKYNFYNVSTQEGELSAEARENQLLAGTYGIEPIQIQAVENDEVKFQKAYMGLVIIYGDQLEKVDPITTTDSLEYRISSGIAKLSRKITALATLEDKIKIDFFLSPNLKNVAEVLRIDPVTFDSLPTEVAGIVDKLNSTSFNKIEYNFHGSENIRDYFELAEKYDVLIMEWPEVPELNIKADYGIIGVSVRYQDRTVAIPVLNIIEMPPFGMRYTIPDGYLLEQQIAGAVDNVAQINDIIGYIADHGNPLHQSANQPGMPESEDTLKIFGDLVNKTYSIKDVFMSRPGAMQGFKTMVIARPNRPFNDYELFQLDQFIMQGNSVAIYVDKFIDVANLEPGPNPMMKNRPVWRAFDSGLEKLLEHYAGLKIEEAVILDKNSWRQPLPPEMGGGDRPVYMAPILKQENINGNPSYMKNIPALVALKVSPITVNADYAKQQGVTVTELVRSSNESWLMDKFIDLNPANVPPPSENQEFSSYAFAYMLEGEFKSYFADKEIPVEQAKGGQQQPQTDADGNPVAQPEPSAQPDIKVRENFIAQGKPGKIFVFTSADVLGDGILDEEATTPNSIFTLNVLDYLNGQEEMAIMRSKTQAITLLDTTDANTKTFTKSFNIAAVPVLVIICGILVWIWRKQRQRKIRNHFLTKRKN